MTNTQRIHPVKRVITFIMALLMVLSSVICYNFTSNAAHDVTLQIYMGDATSVNLSNYFSEQSANGLPNWYGIVSGASSNTTSLRNLLAPQAFTDMFTPNFSRTGYKFGGMYYYSNNGVNDWIGPFGPDQAIDTTANRVWYLNPYWVPETYTLTLKANGGTINGAAEKEYSIQYNQSYKAAFNNSFPTPVRDGYEFQYYDYNNGVFGLTESSWENNYYTLTDNATMTAVWKCLHPSATETVTKAATCTSTGTKKIYCSQCQEEWTESIPKTAHSYGWASQGTDKYDLYECSTCHTISKKRIHITYSANGGTEASVKTQTAEVNTTSSSTIISFTPDPAATPTAPSGQSFKGWSTDPHAEEADESFSSDKNYTLYAVYGKTPYTITFDPGTDDTLTPAKPGKLPDGIDTVEQIYYNDPLTKISATIPKPVLPGYTFVGWRVYNNGIKGGIYTEATWSSSYYRPEPVGNTVFKAEYTKNTEYTLTIDVNGGTMPSGYKTTYKFLQGQLFADVIGGYPVPTKDDYDFLGWRNANYEADFWEYNWGTQPYTYSGNITIKAEWGRKEYTITFDLNDNEQYPAAQDSSFVMSYGINLDETVEGVVGGFPIPTREKYIFKGWGLTVIDENGKTVNKLFTPETGWDGVIHKIEGNVAAVANWRWWCDHKDDSGNYHTLTWQDGEQRDYGYCPECLAIAAYGYEVKLWNRSGSICLSEKLPMEDLFKMDGTSENLIFDKETSRVVDYLDDDNDPMIMIDFNPCLVAAKNTENAWVGWTYYDSRGDKHTIAHDNKYGWQYIFDDDYVDPGAGVEGAGPQRNTHLNLYAVYTDGYYEVVFDGGVNNDTNGEAPNGDGVIVDSDRRYGVMAIMKDQTYKDCLYYIPTAKHTENSILYCSVGWKHADNAHIENHDHLIDCTSWNEGEKYQHGADSIIYAHYTYYNGDNGKYHYSYGYLSTYYANNKYAHMNGGTYNNAYFDPNENSGGTMYYIYYRPTDANGNYLTYSAGMEYAYDIVNDPEQKNKYPVVCEPLFAYDPAEDYLNAFKYTPTTHVEYKADFNINVYIDKLLQYGVVIAKEPKRYTIYVGEGTHFTFPTVVCDPEGNTNADTVYDNETDTFLNQKTVNGNTFFTTINGKNFTVTRNEQLDKDGNLITRWPTMFIYTEATTLGTYHTASSLYYPEAKDLKMGLLPYTDNKNKTQAVDVHNYETIFPYGSREVYFHAPYSDVNGTDEKLYMDYNTNRYYSANTVYGSGLKLTYPNSYGTLNPAFTEQYAYYQQWDYAVAFNANYPTGQTPDYEGYTDSNTVYNMVSPLTGFYAYDDDLFTLDNYVITSWNTKPDGSGITIEVDTNYNALSATCLLKETGIILYAQWEKACNFTLVEDGSGANPFAWVTYTKAGTQTAVTDSDIKNTKTFKCAYGTTVTVTNVKAASGFEFAYFTWNNSYKDVSNPDTENRVDLRKKSDRILTNRQTYSFTIVDHSAMTVEFVKEGKITGFYIDRNNKLLRSGEDSWKLYSADGDRSIPTVADGEKQDQALYYNYSSKTSYGITVSGSTYTAMNKTHTVLYDDVITLMTDAVSGTSKFVGWQIGGKFVSYDPIYKHRATCDATVTAVYSGEAAASVNLLKNADDTVIIQRSAPDGYTLVESGFLITTDSTELTFDALVAKDSSYKTTVNNVENTYYTYRLTTTDTDINGTFKLRLASGTYYGYGFAIYKDAEGNLVILTTDWLSI